MLCCLLLYAAAYISWIILTLSRATISHDYEQTGNYCPPIAIRTLWLCVKDEVLGQSFDLSPENLLVLWPPLHIIFYIPA